MALLKEPITGFFFVPTLGVKILALIAFDKDPLGHKNLIALFRNRGLEIEDEKKVYWCLETIGYYRLSGFCLPFQNKKLQFNQHNFKPGTKFEDVLSLYYFDSDLREITSNALASLEVALRTSICERMCGKYNDSHWYTKANSYDVGKHQDVYDSATKELNFNPINRTPPHPNPDRDKIYARQLFLDHYYSKYNPPTMPPAWMLRETANFTFWAKTFEALKIEDQKIIVQKWKYFDKKSIDADLFSGWLRSLTILRNRCSHLNRITNRTFPFEPKLPSSNASKEIFESKTDNLRTLFSIILILTETSLPNFDWRGKLLRVFNDYPNVNIEQATGFQKEDNQAWQETKFWTFGEGSD